MCGIAGKLVLAHPEKVERKDIEAMLRPMTHRGPDGEGIYLDRKIGLGHLRLSIIDLAAGAQPMANEDETVWIVFNGEIYNFQELHDRLVARGHVFRSRCDTEVIIHLYEEFGPNCVNQLRGMFAFAVWDTKASRLLLARDRVGIKPLYYCQANNSLYFASELKAIVANPNISRELSHSALRTFLSFNYIPGEETLFKSVRKLLPGHFLLVENGKIASHQYWDLRFTDTRHTQSFDAAVEELYQLMQRTVSDHMMADVPVGVLLSGGVDSSAILSLAVEGTGKKVSTFTVGFDGNEVVDERPYARMAAQRFGADHHEISISEEDFWSFLPSYVWHMEEPIYQPPAVALHYISKLARNHVKVLLSGEGGDEAFAGYPNYPNMMRLDRLRTMLGPFARMAGVGIGLAGKCSGDSRLRRYGYALGRPLADHYFSRTSNPTAFFNQSPRILLDEDFLQNTSKSSPAHYVARLLEPAKGESLLNQMLYVDAKTWLPDDLLLKADKMTMANSLELRVPLLDHQVLEFAASLPPEFKVRGKDTKCVLKAAFGRVLPKEILTRKKAGFPVPYHSWMRNGLAERTRDILLSTKAQSRGYFNKDEIMRLLNRNTDSGRGAQEIFSLLIRELWHQQFAD